MDKFYQSLKDSGASIKELKMAGWIDTPSFTKRFSNLLTTNVVLPKEKDEVFVLVATGSFAPFHDGHFNMLLSAKKEMEKRGVVVDAIIISPSHDDYVLKKAMDMSMWGIENRINWLSLMIKQHALVEEENLWFIDLWESSVCEIPINFTDVILKIENDIKKFWNKKVRIGYVFGDDNYSFAEAFRYIEEKDKYFAICVERYGNEVKESKNIIIVNGKRFEISSSEIRKEMAYGKIQKNNNGVYFLREDTSFAIRKWVEKFGNKDLFEHEYFKFTQKLVRLLSESTKREVLIVPLGEQEKLLDKIKIGRNIINLDICTNENENFGFSRWFYLNDIQNSPKGVVKRGEFVFPDCGEYILVDDDICTGRTIKMIKEKMCNSGIKILDEISLLDEWRKERGGVNDVFDVLDVRDFLVGANGGGLLCNFAGNMVRVPYWFPWVNLTSRAKILWKEQLKFTKKVIELNIEFYENIKCNMGKDIMPNFVNGFLKF